MSKNPDNNNTIFTNVVSGVLIGVILLICTTLYNLFLAHIWPVTIHFGEYSLNNFIFILVSVISSILFAVIILSLEMFYVFNIFARAILYWLTPADKRRQRKRRWFKYFEYILNAFLLAATGIFSLLAWVVSLTNRKEAEQPGASEEVQTSFTNTPFIWFASSTAKKEAEQSATNKEIQLPPTNMPRFNIEQKLEQKQEHQHPTE